MKVEATRCPRCNEPKLRVESRITSSPVRPWQQSPESYAAVQVWPYLVCDGCGIRAPAKEESVRRRFIWTMKFRKSGTGTKMTNPLSPEDLRDERVVGPATFDDGRRYVVVEKIKDLEWAVFDTRVNRMMDHLSMDRDSAIWYCIALNDTRDRGR